jgi:hypothetical protein
VGARCALAGGKRPFYERQINGFPHQMSNQLGV